MKKIIATLCAAAALATTAATTEAMAGGKHHHHHFRHFHYGYVYVAPRPACGFERWKWKTTGAFYWKKQYYLCKGWW
jgi:hypothetical protein